MIYLTLVAVLLGAADEASAQAKPVAPSLPALTKEEEAKLETVVDRLILADTGRLRGDDARKAVKEFDKLGPEAIPALIRGLQRSAKMSQSCPVVLIAKKLIRLLDASTDPILLEYARDEIGAGIKGSAHAANPGGSALPRHAPQERRRPDEAGEHAADEAGGRTDDARTGQGRLDDARHLAPRRPQGAGQARRQGAPSTA